eukprot:CAMPEP_0178987898 /NCGR_PEP_ID=MMETSP0795-20121207/3524_1 /TAXON_ID=88552 /ORGANISM="Amoebophrya sp., Strain Ameob2" /LENGTH=1011 /DNA_ID=CAMNT_0020679139 /DNA_START=33 /DNA_END=3070 /DNA_ORIENTATION=-
MLSSNRNPLVLASSATRPGLTNTLTAAGPAAQLAVPRATISGFSGFSISPGPPRPRGLDAPTTNITTIAYNNANAALLLRPPAAQQLAPPLPLLMGSSDGPVVNLAPGSLLGSYRDPRPRREAPPISAEGGEGRTSSSGAAGDEVAHHEQAQHHDVQDFSSSLGPDVGVRSAAANASGGGASVPAGRQTENSGPNYTTNTVGFRILPPLSGMTTSGSVSPPLPRPSFLFNNDHDAGSSPSPVDSDITVTYEAFRFSPVDSLEDLRGSRRNSLNMNLARAPGAWSSPGAEAIDARHNLSSASPEAERRAFYAHDDPLSGTSSGSGTASVLLVPPTGISMPEPNIPMETMRPWGWSATQESDRLTGDLPPPRLNLFGSSSSASLAVGIGAPPGDTVGPGPGPDAEAARSHVVVGGGETSSQHEDAPRGDEDQGPSRAAQNGGAQMNEDETARTFSLAAPPLRQLDMWSHQVPPNPVFDRLMEETRSQLNNIIGNDSIRARLPPYTYFPFVRTAAQESSQLDHAQNLQNVERPNTTSFSPPPGPPLTQRQTLPLSYRRFDPAVVRGLIRPISSTSLQTPDVALRPPDRSPPPILYSRGGAELQQNNPDPGLNGLLDGDSPISDSIEEGRVWGWSPTDDLLRPGSRALGEMHLRYRYNQRNASSNVDAGNNPLGGAALEQSARQRFVLAGRTTTADGGPSLEREDEHELRPRSFFFTGPAASRRPFVAQTPSPTRQAQERTANEIKARIEVLEAVVESAGTTVVDATPEENDCEQDPAPSAEVEASSASSSSSSGHHHGRKDYYLAGGSCPTFAYTSCPAQFLLSSEGPPSLLSNANDTQAALDFESEVPSTRTTTTTTAATAAASKELRAHQEEPSVVCSEASTAGGARRAEADRRNSRLAAQLVESGLLTQAISDLKALQGRLRETTEQQLCVICLDKPREYGFGPCNHLCCCRGCLMRHVANDRFTSMLEAPGVGNRGQLPERNRVDENGVHPTLTCPICTQQAKEWFRVFT